MFARNLKIPSKVAGVHLAPAFNFLNILQSLASSPAKLKSSADSTLIFTERLPLLQSKAERIMAKDSLHLIHDIMRSYFCPVLLAIFSARCLWKTEPSWLIPPLMEKTSGVNEPCSQLMTRSLYFLFFSFSWFLYIVLSGCFHLFQ